MNIHGFRHVSITPARVSRSPVLLESVGADSNNRNLLVYEGTEKVPFFILVKKIECFIARFFLYFYLVVLK